MATLEAIIDEIDQLKPVSDIAGKVMSLLDDPDCGLSDLVDIIRFEPALTTNVLKLANSAYFGLPGKIDDAKQAIIYLGMTQVVELVLLACCSEPFKGSHEGYEMAKGNLWENAVSGAIMANHLAQIKGIKQSSLTFSGALLRDIGKVIMDPYVDSAKDKILGRLKAKDLTFLDAERQVLGYDHTQIGALIAKKWNFPSALQCVLRYYHIPLEAKGCFIEASIVYLADAMCRKMEIGLGLDDAYYMEDERVAKSLGFTEIQTQVVIDDFGQKMERVKALFES
ncbi:putative chemotaxis signal transduction protein [Desulfosarcina variabilis str. Montpellier]|uniref:HDOD domain-containing protein n=1 Tax=Desulfosarcina variabilis TaxID=2300 RepID=UPI003AFAA0E5